MMFEEHTVFLLHFGTSIVCVHDRSLRIYTFGVKRVIIYDHYSFVGTRVIISIVKRNWEQDK